MFDGHFPKFPILPGVLMLEIMNHAAGYLLYRRFNGSEVRLPRRRQARQVPPHGEARRRHRRARARSPTTAPASSIAETSLRVEGEVAADAEIVLIAQDFPTEEARSALATSAIA